MTPPWPPNPEQAATEAERIIGDRAVNRIQRGLPRIEFVLNRGTMNSRVQPLLCCPAALTWRKALWVTRVRKVSTVKLPIFIA